jgi:hypothetical protein
MRKTLLCHPHGRLPYANYLELALIQGLQAELLGTANFSSIAPEIRSNLAQWVEIDSMELVESSTSVKWLGFAYVRV